MIYVSHKWQTAEETIIATFASFRHNPVIRDASCSLSGFFNIDKTGFLSV